MLVFLNRRTLPISSLNFFFFKRYFFFFVSVSFSRLHFYFFFLFDSFLEIFFIFFFLLAFFSFSFFSILQLVVLSELVWLLYFLQIHLLINAVYWNDLVFIFFIFLSIITIDLGSTLAVVLVYRETGNSLDWSTLGLTGANSASFKSLSEGNFLRQPRCV